MSHGRNTMRIVCVSQWFPDYVIQLANALSREHTVKLIMLAPSLPDELLGAVDEAVVIDLLGTGRHALNPLGSLMYKNVVQTVRRFRPDVVHWQLGGNIVDLALLPCFRRYPLVSTFHDVSLHAGEEHRLGNLVRHLIRRSSDAIIVHGQTLRQEMMSRHNMPAGKVHAIHIGEHEVAPFKRYERQDIQEQGNLILFFGRIWEYKGLQYLIEAEPLITAAVPDARIVIAGAGEDFKRYEEMIGNRRDNFIVHNRRIPYDEGAGLFQRCSVVVLPYTEASQSGVVPTAYGFKKPVIVTDVGSIPEIVDNEKTGLVVPPRDAGALAKAIIRLLKDDKLRQRMGETAYQKLKKDFSWDAIAERTGEVYGKAIELAKHRTR